MQVYVMMAMLNGLCDIDILGLEKIWCLSKGMARAYADLPGSQAIDRRFPQMDNWDRDILIENPRLMERKRRTIKQKSIFGGQQPSIIDITFIMLILFEDNIIIMMGMMIQLLKCVLMMTRQKNKKEREVWRERGVCEWESVYVSG